MVKFDEVKKGYKKEQVDEYINTVSAEYEILHEEFKNAKQEIEDRKENEEKLSKKIKQLASNEHNDYQEVIASAILSAETTAKKIVADAKEKAIYMNEKAQGELDALAQTKEDALGEVQALTDALSGLLREEQGNGDFYTKRMMMSQQERK